MTLAYDRLLEGPATGISRGQLNYTERHEVRRISVSGGSYSAHANKPSSTLTDVAYLVGDQEAAVQLWVEENRDALSEIDFSVPNIVWDELDRERYDLVLHELGERVRTKYPTVVHEERSDGTEWLIDRRCYEQHVSKRYTFGNTTSCRIPPEVTTNALYERLRIATDGIISASDVRETPAEGAVQQLLDFYRLDDRFACRPTTVDGELAIATMSDPSN